MTRDVQSSRAGQVPPEHVGAEREQADCENAPQERLRQAAAERMSGERAEAAQGDEGEDCPRIQLDPERADGAEVRDESGGGVARDDHQARSHRERHRQAAEQDEGGNDQKASAHADQPREQTDRGAVERYLPGLPWGAIHRPGELRPPQHEAGRGEHHDREDRKLHRPRNSGCDPRSHPSARHPRQSEQQHAPPVDQPPHRIRNRRERADPRDDRERPSDRLLLSLAEPINQDRDGEDRAAGAKQAERQTDAEGAEDEQEGFLPSGGEYGAGRPRIQRLFARNVSTCSWRTLGKLSRNPSTV